MKPTQQEIIELAREAGITTIHNGYHPVSAFTADQLERLVHLALERFGAGGGEPVYFEVRSEAHPAWMHVDREQFDEYVGYGWTGRKLYTHPTPTDLRAEYLRGLEDAKKVVLDADHMGSVNLKLMKNRIGNSIEALKEQKS